MKLKLAAAAAFLAFGMGSSAFAATFDFAKIANDYKFSNTNKYEGTFNQIVGALGASTFEDGGIKVVDVFSTGSNTQLQSHEFFDGSGNSTQASEGKNLAGLGVCSNGFTTITAPGGGTVSKCSSNAGTSFAGDDNAKGAENAHVVFDQRVDITSMIFRDASHNDFDGLLDFWSTDSSGNKLSLMELTITGGAISSASDPSLLSNIFGFAIGVSSKSTTDKEVYLSLVSVEAVPLPAPAVLLLAGLGGLAAMKRRKKA